MTVKENKDGKPYIAFNNMIYNIEMDNDSTFSIWLGMSTAKSLFTYYITSYKKAVATIGIIAYNVQHQENI